MLHKQEGWLNLGIQFVRIMAVSVAAFVCLVLLPIPLLLLLLWFVWKNLKYSASINKLPAAITDVITNTIARKLATPFVRYLGWFCQNYIYECFIKALKQNRASLKDARHTMYLIKAFTRRMKQENDGHGTVDEGDEFKEVSYEQFRRRNKSYWSYHKGMVFTCPMKCACQFALSVNEDDELVFYVAARQVFNFIRKIPYVGKWHFVNKGLSSLQETLYQKRFRATLREKLASGMRVYVDNMMRTCSDYNAFNALDAWSIATKEFFKAIEIEPNVANEVKIAKCTAQVFDLMNEAGRQTYIAVVQNDGFKIAQDDYIDVTVDSSAISGHYVGPVVYVEGRTDERYFNRALKAYGLKVCFRYVWIGSIDSKGNEINSGGGALKNAASVYVAHNPSDRTVIQFDCDQPHPDKRSGTVWVRSLAKCKNSKDCVSGVENALVLDGIDQKKWDTFFDKRIVRNAYGKDGVKYDLKKMKLCEYICALPDEECRKIFKNLKSEIDKVTKWFDS